MLLVPCSISLHSNENSKSIVFNIDTEDKINAVLCAMESINSFHQNQGTIFDKSDIHPRRLFFNKNSKQYFWQITSCVPTHKGLLYTNQNIYVGEFDIYLEESENNIVVGSYGCNKTTLYIPPNNETATIFVVIVAFFLPDNAFLKIHNLINYPNWLTGDHVEKRRKQSNNPLGILSRRLKILNKNIVPELIIIYDFKEQYKQIYKTKNTIHELWNDPYI
jgi:hypothetical protein